MPALLDDPILSALDLDPTCVQVSWVQFTVPKALAVTSWDEVGSGGIGCGSMASLGLVANPVASGGLHCGSLATIRILVNPVASGGILASGDTVLPQLVYDLARLDLSICRVVSVDLAVSRVVVLDVSVTTEKSYSVEL